VSSQLSSECWNPPGCVASTVPPPNRPRLRPKLPFIPLHLAPSTQRLRRVTLILNVAGMLLQAHGSASSQMKPAPSHWLATNKAALAAVVPGSRALKWKRLSLYLRSAILAAKKSREPRSAGGDFSDENSASRGQKSSSGDLAGRAITVSWELM